MADEGVFRGESQSYQTSGDAAGKTVSLNEGEEYKLERSNSICKQQIDVSPTENVDYSTQSMLPHCMAEGSPSMTDSELFWDCEDNQQRTNAQGEGHITSHELRYNSGDIKLVENVTECCSYDIFTDMQESEHNEKNNSVESILINEEEKELGEVNAFVEDFDASPSQNMIREWNNSTRPCDEMDIDYGPELDVMEPVATPEMMEMTYAQYQNGINVPETINTMLDENDNLEVGENAIVDNSKYFENPLSNDLCSETEAKEMDIPAEDLENEARKLQETEDSDLSEDSTESIHSEHKSIHIDFRVKNAKPAVTHHYHSYTRCEINSMFPTPEKEYHSVNALTSETENVDDDEDKTLTQQSIPFDSPPLPVETYDREEEINVLESAELDYEHISEKCIDEDALEFIVGKDSDQVNCFKKASAPFSSNNLSSNLNKNPAGRHSLISQLLENLAAESDKNKEMKMEEPFNDVYTIVTELVGVQTDRPNLQLIEMPEHPLEEGNQNMINSESVGEEADNLKSFNVSELAEESKEMGEAKTYGSFEEYEKAALPGEIPDKNTVPRLIETICYDVNSFDIDAHDGFSVNPDDQQPPAQEASDTTQVTATSNTDGIDQTCTSENILNHMEGDVDEITLEALISDMNEMKLVSDELVKEAGINVQSDGQDKVVAVDETKTMKDAYNTSIRRETNASGEFTTSFTEFELHPSMLNYLSNQPEMLSGLYNEAQAFQASEDSNNETKQESDKVNEDQSRKSEYSVESLRTAVILAQNTETNILNIINALMEADKTSNSTKNENAATGDVPAGIGDTAQNVINDIMKNAELGNTITNSNNVNCDIIDSCNIPDDIPKENESKVHKNVFASSEDVDVEKDSNTISEEIVNKFEHNHFDTQENLGVGEDNKNLTDGMENEKEQNSSVTLDEIDTDIKVVADEIQDKEELNVMSPEELSEDIELEEDDETENETIFDNDGDLCSEITEVIENDDDDNYFYGPQIKEESSIVKVNEIDTDIKVDDGEIQDKEEQKVMLPEEVSAGNEEVAVEGNDLSILNEKDTGFDSDGDLCSEITEVIENEDDNLFYESEIKEKPSVANENEGIVEGLLEEAINFVEQAMEAVEQITAVHPKHLGFAERNQSSLDNVFPGLDEIKSQGTESQSEDTREIDELLNRQLLDCEKHEVEWMHNRSSESVTDPASTDQNLEFDSEEVDMEEVEENQNYNTDGHDEDRSEIEVDALEADECTRILESVIGGDREVNNSRESLIDEELDSSVHDMPICN